VLLVVGSSSPSRLQRCPIHSIWDRIELGAISIVAKPPEGNE